MDLQLRISGHGLTSMKLGWTVDGTTPYEPYLVGRNTLVAAVARSRKLLDRLTDLQRRRADDQYPALFAELADAGADLSIALFTPSDGGDAAAHEVKKLIEETSGGRLLVFSDASVHVPWNFVYRGSDPRAFQYTPHPEGGATDFWVSLFSITTRFTKTRYMPDQPIPRHEFRALYAISEVELAAVTPSLTEDEIKALQGLLQCEVGHAKTLDECKSRWERMKASDGLLYFFGHSDGTRIRLDRTGDTGELNNLKFVSWFRKEGAKPYSATISFFNGCRTLSGDGDDGFLTATAAPGFQGFIGVEATVENVFATKCAIRFLTYLCEHGHSVQEAIDLLHADRDLFPLSLLYSCYAHPHFRVSPSRAGTPPQATVLH